MAKLIIICGLPASGKTTLARELSKKLRIACFHKDTLKGKIYDLFGGKSLKDSIKIGQQSIKLLFLLIEEQLSRKVDVIAEAPFNFPEGYPLFEKWKKKYKLDLYSVICSADKKIRKKRFNTRMRHRAHHDRDRDVNFDSEYSYKNIPGKKIKINTEKPLKELVSEVVSKLKI